MAAALPVYLLSFLPPPAPPAPPVGAVASAVAPPALPGAAFGLAPAAAQAASGRRSASIHDKRCLDTVAVCVVIAAPSRPRGCRTPRGSSGSGPLGDRAPPRAEP